jgi:phosphosulfolactate synthase (CoM biosynthesis protein A)
MASIDIEIEDILWGMSDREKQELVDDLYEDGFIAKKDDSEKNTDDAWNEQVHKLFNNKWRLSSEDEETILNITKKIVV